MILQKLTPIIFKNASKFGINVLIIKNKILVTFPLDVFGASWGCSLL